MLTKEQANDFATGWIAAWNSHNLDAILSFYTADINFASPMIVSLNVNTQGLITGKDALRAYFKIGLEAYPELNFQLFNVFSGVDTVVIYYESVKGKLAAEVFTLNDSGKALQVTCNYV